MPELTENQSPESPKKSSIFQVLKGAAVVSLIVLLLVFAPTIAYVEYQRSTIEHASEVVESISGVLGRNHGSGEATDYEGLIEDLEALAEKRPEVRNFGLFYLMKLSAMNPEKDSDLYQATLNQAVSRLSDRPHELMFVATSVEDSHRMVTIEGERVDLKACGEELVDRFEVMKREAESESNLFGYWMLMNEMGFPGWGLEGCSQLR